MRLLSIPFLAVFLVAPALCAQASFIGDEVLTQSTAGASSSTGRVIVEAGRGDERQLLYFTSDTEAASIILRWQDDCSVCSLIIPGDPTTAFLGMTWTNFDLLPRLEFIVEVLPLSGSPTLWGATERALRIDTSNAGVSINFAGLEIQPLEVWEFQVVTNVIPEPSTASLLALGLVGIAAMRRRAAA